MSFANFPKRTIHLDFHTGPHFPGVGSEFDAKEFAQTFKDAHVDSVTVFATGHHGHAYWNTKRPERHPTLRANLDLLGEQIEALHSVGIKAPVYFSVQCNEFCADLHPDWIALNPDGTLVKRRSFNNKGVLGAGWQIMDMSSPYQDYLADQLEEVLSLYGPVDGVFMDMCWDQPSVSKWAWAGMKKLNLDPLKEEDRNKYARHTAHVYMGRYKGIVDKYNKEKPVGVWFNSRPKTNLFEEKTFLRHVEVEALPTGGWGYAYFPYVSRFVRPLGLPTLSHTGRFFKSWGDNGGLKPEMALKYECCSILAQGLTNGVGDLLPPQGKPNKSVYELIGKVYKHVEECEPFVEGGTHLADGALVIDPALGDRPGDAGLGATRMLSQLRFQFDIIPPHGDFSSYKVLILPSTTVVNEEFADKLKKYVKEGGSLILSGQDKSQSDNPLFSELGITCQGESPYEVTFFHCNDLLNDNLGEPLPSYGYAMYERGNRIKPAAGGESLISVTEPPFEANRDHFSGHAYVPDGVSTNYSGAVKKGRIITFGVPIFTAYGKSATPQYRNMVQACLNMLIPEPLMRDEGPTVMESTMVETDKSLVTHILSFSAERRAENLDVVEDAFPLVNVPVQIKSEKAPVKVTLQPFNQSLEYSYSKGYVSLDLTLLDGHGMIVLDY